MKPLKPAKNPREVATNKELLRSILSKVLGRELSTEEAIDLAIRGVRIFGPLTEARDPSKFHQD
jgi:hypothetical protein